MLMFYKTVLLTIIGLVSLVAYKALHFFGYINFDIPLLLVMGGMISLRLNTEILIFKCKEPELRNQKITHYCYNGIELFCIVMSFIILHTLGF